MATANSDARYIPPGSCSWCGHKPHDAPCSDRIRTAPKTTSPCPCNRHGH